MNIFELIILGFALSADSFLASVTMGIEVNNLNIKNKLIISFMFSFFQSLMPLLGFILTSFFAPIITSFDHWVSFFVLGYLGIGMILKKDEEENISYINLSSLILISIAVTIDAFTIGITYRLLNINIFLTIILNFSITFITTIIGLKVGSLLNKSFKSYASITGGLILISLGLKVLLTHLGIFL